MSEWRNFTEAILNNGASQAYLEYYKDPKLLHKSEPSEEDFRKKVIFLAFRVAARAIGVLDGVKHYTGNSGCLYPKFKTSLLHSNICSACKDLQAN